MNKNERIDGLAERLRVAARNKALPISDACGLLEEAASALQAVFDVLDCEAVCLCCGGEDICEDECSFSEDCPDEYCEMELAREILRVRIRDA